MRWDSDGVGGDGVGDHLMGESKVSEKSSEHNNGKIELNKDFFSVAHIMV